jgi:HSP20 family molecular chaperone IbpA
MALIPHKFFPRGSFDVDNWLHPTLDVFDAFDEFDHMLGRNMEWLERPSFLEPLALQPRVPEKYRVTVDVAGFQPKSIKAEVKDGRLIVWAREEQKHDKDGDFEVKEFKKTYQLPENAEVEKLAVFVAGGQLVAEVPLKVQRQLLPGEDLFPHVVENKDGTRKVTLNCTVPRDIHPENVSVTCKDRDLIIKAEDKIEKPDRVSRVYYYKRCTLPENTDFNALKCHFENNKLAIEAPVNPTYHKYRHIPIENKPLKQLPSAATGR